MGIIEHKLFPTTVLSFESSAFSEQDRNTMVGIIDMLMDIPGLLVINERVPRYQSEQVLFHEGAPDVFERLKNSFVDACAEYLKRVPGFLSNSEYIKISCTNAWFYKSWKDLMNAGEHLARPWHDHNPATLSGVFYLKVPGPSSTSGTEFIDPRKNQCISKSCIISTPVVDLGWTIFPGWLQHRSTYTSTDEARYVIAADAYTFLDTTYGSGQS